MIVDTLFFVALKVIEQLICIFGHFLMPGVRLVRVGLRYHTSVLHHHSF